MKISIAIRDKVGKNFAREEIRFVHNLSRSDLQRIAKETEAIIKEKIMTLTKMPTGRLASYFYAEDLSSGNTVAWGIGNITELDEVVPYWNHINVGSEGIGANWSHYLPKGFWSNGRWVESASGYAGIKPQTPIQGINYVAKTIAEMTSRIPQLLKNTNISSILLRSR